MAKSVGFIGLGKMGMPMALNLCKKGFEVYAHSSKQASEDAIIAAGGHSIGSFAEMAEKCDVVITIVPADKEIVGVYSGEDGVFAHAHKGLVCIDMTSALGSTKIRMAEEAKKLEKDIHFLDAPVSGGVKGATQGTLTIMVGSSKEDFDANQNVFKAMGTKIFYTGDVGCGSNIKMLNQMLNAANTAIAAEVLCLSRKLGVDDKILSEIINQSSGASYVFERNVPKFMMTGDHTPGFRLDLMKKDVGLFVDTARAEKAYSPISNLVYQEYQATSNQGMGDKSYTAIFEWLKKSQAPNS